MSDSNKRAASPDSESKVNNNGHGSSGGNPGSDPSKRRAVEKSNNTDSTTINDVVDATQPLSQSGSKNIETETVVIRAIIESKHTGTIIGKQGTTISWIRTQSEAKVNVSDADRTQQSDERIVTVSGTCADVFRAFSFICGKIKESQMQNSVANSPDAATGVVTLTLTIPNMQAGAVIGKKGAKIKEIRDATGATINLDQELLPNSTERPCVVAGSVEAVAQSVFHIACTLVQTPNKGQHVAYMPGSKAAGGGGQFRGQQQQQSQQPQQPPLGFGPQGSYTPQQHYAGQQYAGYQAPAQAQQQLSVSNEIIGAIIGRQGAHINEIRQISHANIKIGDKIPGAMDRTIMMSGSAEAVQMAQYLIQTKMQEAMIQNMQNQNQNQNQNQQS